jgi:fluoroquinolone transport system permease protein
MRSDSIALFRYDFTLLYRHGFVAAYALIGITYAAIAGALPRPWADAVLPVMVWSDPVFFGFFFAGATVCLDLAQGTFRVLAVTPLKPPAYFLVKSANLALLAFAMAVGISLAVRGLAFRPLVLLVAIVLGGAPSALLGAALALRLGSINRFMVGAIPGLLWFSLPVLVYAAGQWLPDWVFWLGRLSPVDGSLRWAMAAFATAGTSAGPGSVNLGPGALALAAAESLAWTGLVARFALAPAVAAAREA